LPEDEILFCPEVALAEHIGAADVAIPLMARLPAEIIEKGQNLRLIHQFGVGLEGVDLAAAKRLGVSVANVPSRDSGNAVSVAEWAIFLMIALARDFAGQQESVRAERLGVPVGTTLFGKTAGVVGLGNLGQAVAPRLQALGMKVRGFEQALENIDADALGLDYLGGPDDLGQSLGALDFLVLTVPLTEETRGLVGRAVFDRMKPSAFLINVCRGPVVDYESLMGALQEKRIAGAGLDVFWSEPIRSDDPLLHQNVVASPHIAGVTDFSYDNIARAVADNVERLRAGQPLKNAAV
jgi:phosphoglycerate dehydrogenase-like enzyme